MLIGINLMLVDLWKHSFVNPEINSLPKIWSSVSKGANTFSNINDNDNEA